MSLQIVSTSLYVHSLHATSMTSYRPRLLLHIQFNKTNREKGVLWFLFVYFGDDGKTWSQWRKKNHMKKNGVFNHVTRFGSTDDPVRAHAVGFKANTKCECCLCEQFLVFFFICAIDPSVCPTSVKSIFGRSKNDKKKIEKKLVCNAHYGLQFYFVAGSVCNSKRTKCCSYIRESEQVTNIWIFWINSRM